MTAKQRPVSAKHLENTFKLLS